MTGVALVTGGSSGLGFALARELFLRGMETVLVARDAQKLDRARELLEQVRPRGHNAHIRVYQCDVGDELQLKDLFLKLQTRYRQIDYLVLNAGQTTVNRLRDHESLEEVLTPVRVNLLGSIAAAYLSLPLLRKGSRVLFVSSGFGLLGAAGYSPYCASKAGINMFAEAFRRELLAEGIRVHLACPGDIDTPMYHHELEVMPGWMRAKSARGQPMGVQRAARRILRACAKDRHLIAISADVKLLLWVQKLLPRTVSTYLFDKLLPLPATAPPPVMTDPA